MNTEQKPRSDERPPNPVRQFLEATAEAIRTADRLGTEFDSPEGSRFIQVSDSYAIGLAEQLDKAAVQIDIFAYSDENLHSFATLLTMEIRRRQELARRPVIIHGRG